MGRISWPPTTVSTSLHSVGDDDLSWHPRIHGAGVITDLTLFIVGVAGGRLGELVFFGSGSVGSSAIGLLSTQTDLVGRAVVVDPDNFDSQRNPYRYPASTGTETGPKAPWTAGLLSGSGWTA